MAVPRQSTEEVLCTAVNATLLTKLSANSQLLLLLQVLLSRD